MNRLMLLILIITILPLNFADAKEKIGKINIGLLASLHPEMSKFDFQTMGFSKEMLSKYKHWEPYIKEFTKTETSIKELEAKKEKRAFLEEQIRFALSKKSEIFDRNKTTLLEKLQEKDREEIEKLDRYINDKLEEEAILDYSIRNPNFTLPDETMKILSVIEQEIIEAVELAAEKNDCDVVLNSTIPNPYGYPVSYHKSPDYYNGAIGINQSTYYAILSTKIEGRYAKDWQKTKIKEWLAMISRPSLQDELPVKPYPLVLKGGFDLLPSALEILYEKYNVDSQVYNAVIEVLNEYKGGIYNEK